MNTLVVNFYGGPGSGKSTMTAHVFALLKWDGYNVEIASEYAKDKVWEGSTHVLGNQEYVFGKQYKRIKQLVGQVEIILTDGPLLHSIIYADPEDHVLTDIVVDRYRSFNNLDIFLQRQKKYNPSGRTQTLEEAKEIDERTEQMLKKYVHNLKYSLGVRESAEALTEKIKHECRLLGEAQR